MPPKKPRSQQRHQAASTNHNKKRKRTRNKTAQKPASVAQTQTTSSAQVQTILAAQTHTATHEQKTSASPAFTITLTDAPTPGGRHITYKTEVTATGNSELNIQRGEGGRIIVSSSPTAPPQSVPPVYTAGEGMPSLTLEGSNSDAASNPRAIRVRASTSKAPTSAAVTTPIFAQANPQPMTLDNKPVKQRYARLPSDSEEGEKKPPAYFEQHDGYNPLPGGPEEGSVPEQKESKEEAEADLRARESFWAANGDKVQQLFPSETKDSFWAAHRATIKKRTLPKEDDESFCATHGETIKYLLPSILSGMTNATNAGLGVFLVYALATDTSPVTLAQIIDDGLDASPSQLAEWLALTACAFSDLVNTLNSLDFLPTLRNLYSNIWNMASDAVHGRLKWSKRTAAGLGVAAASLGSAITASLISYTTFKEAEEKNYPAYLIMTIASVSFGAMMMLASRYDGAMERINKEKSLYSEEDFAMMQLFESLRLAAVDLANKIDSDNPTTTSDQHPVNTQPSQDPQKNAEDIEAIFVSINTVFAQYHMEPPANLKEIVTHAYNNEMLRLISEKHETEISWRLRLYAVVCGAAGFATYSMKFGTLFQPNNTTISYETDADIAKIAAGLFVGGLLSSTTLMLNMMSAETVFGFIGKHWPNHKFQTVGIISVNMPASLSMFTVGYKIAKMYQLPENVAILFGAINSMGAWNINTKSCFRITQKIQRLHAEKDAKKKKRLSQSIRKDLIAIAYDYTLQAKQFQDVKEAITNQKKPRSESTFKAAYNYAASHMPNFFRGAPPETPRNVAPSHVSASTPTSPRRP